MSKKTVLGLDVGTRRIGVARGDVSEGLAFPLTTLAVNGSECEHITTLAFDNECQTIVIGYPRNQAGEPTAQSAMTEAFATRLRRTWTGTIVFQDESLTSVLAEERLRAFGRPYTKEAIDAEAATIILQDYLEVHHEH